MIIPKPLSEKKKSVFTHQKVFALMFSFFIVQEDRPLFVQFCANNPATLVEAARYVEPYCDYIDLNLG